MKFCCLMSPENWSLPIPMRGIEKLFRWVSSYSYTSCNSQGSRYFQWHFRLAKLYYTGHRGHLSAFQNVWIHECDCSYFIKIRDETNLSLAMNVRIAYNIRRPEVIGPQVLTMKHLEIGFIIWLVPCSFSWLKLQTDLAEEWSDTSGMRLLRFSCVHFGQSEKNHASVSKRPTKLKTPGHCKVPANRAGLASGLANFQQLKSRDPTLDRRPATGD